jgi:hypothetical protein
MTFQSGFTQSSIFTAKAPATVGGRYNGQVGPGIQMPSFLP